MTQEVGQPTLPDELTRDERIVVAMSGGVDSSVVAALLRRQGHDLVGISMRLYRSGHDGPAKGCCSPDDLFDARQVASDLDMPFYVVNYEEEFERRVIDVFVAEYRRGRTPSPCILCNDHVKFDTLLNMASSISARRLATGHYARIERGPDGRHRLLRGRDRAKDQSYFLFGIKHEVLKRLMFPLGDMTKAQVRALASEFELPTAVKPESQDLCFVGGRHYLDFLESRLAEHERVPGEIVYATTGEVAGTHEGIHRFTVGQRRGLGIGGSEGPLYVVGLSPETGRVTVGPREALLASTCTISRCNWLAFDELKGPLEALVQVRYRHRAVPATIEPLEGATARVRFRDPEAAIAPGQAVVAYRDDEVLGGGWIDTPA